MKRNLTRRYLDALETRQAREFVFDEKVPHLAIQVTAGGCKTWYLYRRVNGRPKQIKIGRYPAVTPDQARRQAQRMNGLVAAGGDPSEQSTDEMTFADLWEKYLEFHAKPMKKSWRRDQRRYDYYLAKRFATRRLSELTTADFQRLHAEMGAKNGKGQANVIRTLLSSIFTFAGKSGYWTGKNPVRDVDRYPQNERERYLSGEEMPKFFTELEKSRAEIFRDYVKLSLYTGARQANVLAMRWDQVDFDRRLWTIPGAEHKSGKPTPTVLTEACLEILRRRQHDTSGPFVFPGRDHGHYGRPRTAWSRLMKRCGFSENLVMHDLRRTFGSWQAAAGISLHIIGKSLGHTSTSATAIYARLDTDPVRRSVEAATAAIQAAGNVKGAEGGAT
ncbi:MAG: tyrosine-type recombinase/integrase [Pirellulaceae bacterium]